MWEYGVRSLALSLEDVKMCSMVDRKCENQGNLLHDNIISTIKQPISKNKLLKVDTDTRKLWNNSDVKFENRSLFKSRNATYGCNKTLCIRVSLVESLIIILIVLSSVSQLLLDPHGV